MHLEVEEVRRWILPGKSELPLELWSTTFVQAVALGGRGQVSKDLLAVLADTPRC